MQELRPYLDRLAAIDTTPEAEAPNWQSLEEALTALKTVMHGLSEFARVKVFKYIFFAYIPIEYLNICTSFVKVTFFFAFYDNLFDLFPHSGLLLW